MDYWISALDMFGFLVLTVLVGGILTYKAGRLKAWLDERKKCIDKHAQESDAVFWKMLNEPNAVALLILLFGTVFVLASKVLVVYTYIGSYRFVPSDTCLSKLGIFTLR